MVQVAPAVHVSALLVDPVESTPHVEPVHVSVESAVPCACTVHDVPTPQLVVSVVVPRPSIEQRVPGLMQSVVHDEPPVQVIVHGQPMPHVHDMVPVHIWTVG